MKTCSLCSLKLPFSSFNKRPNRPGQYQSVCRDCNKEYQRNHYRKNKKTYKERAKLHKQSMRNQVQEIKGSNPCVDCGGMFHFSQMDFDHLENKSFEISRMYTYSWQSIQAELSKCDLVCSNCHRLRTYHRKEDLLKLSGIGTEGIAPSSLGS